MTGKYEVYVDMKLKKLLSMFLCILISKISVENLNK